MSSTLDISYKIIRRDNKTLFFWVEYCYLLLDQLELFVNRSMVVRPSLTPVMEEHLNTNQNNRNKTLQSPFDVNRLETQDANMLLAMDHLFEGADTSDSDEEDDYALAGCLLSRLGGAGGALNVCLYVAGFLTGSVIMNLKMMQILESADISPGDKVHHVTVEMIQFFMWLMAIDVGRFVGSRMMGETGVTYTRRLTVRPISVRHEVMEMVLSNLLISLLCFQYYLHLCSFDPNFRNLGVMMPATLIGATGLAVVMLVVLVHDEVMYRMCYRSLGQSGDDFLNSMCPSLPIGCQRLVGVAVLAAHVYFLFDHVVMMGSNMMYVFNNAE